MAEHILREENQGTLTRRYQLLALAGLIVLFWLPSDGVGITLCPLSNLSGLDCPACGLTRSVSSLLHLDFSRSLSYHPLGTLALFGLLLIASPLRCAEKVNESKRFSSFYSYRWQIVVTLFVIVWAFRLLAGALPN
ncbi:MAG: DUF2752 domain-containing protein [candidate division Zixibacteria bacterium]|nr:DUF2752 domain-containing protein [candidate division Zixibacteria bacterium]